MANLRISQLPELITPGSNDFLAIVDTATNVTKKIKKSNLIAGIGTGTVTSVSIVTANGISGSVSNPSTTPAITLTLGAITPTSVNGITLIGASTPTLTVTGTTAVSGTNTGDITIAGENYLTLVGQVLTANAVNLAGTNVTGTLPLTKGGTGQITANLALNALLPSQGGNSGKFLQTNGTNTSWVTVSSGTGDVVGPSSATDNAVARFDGTTGKLIQNSAVTISDTGNITTAGSFNGNFLTLGTGTLTLNSYTITVFGSGSLSGTNTGDQFLFKTIAVAGASSFSALSATDTLRFAEGNNITITTDPTTNTVRIDSIPGALGVEGLTGAVNGSNTVFTVVHIPAFITVQGQVMIDGDGFTRSGLTITFDNAPQTGNSLHNFFNEASTNVALDGYYVGTISAITT